MQSLIENQTYDQVELPEGRKSLRNKWLFKLKNDENNPNPRYKARIMGKDVTRRKT